VTSAPAPDLVRRNDGRASFFLWIEPWAEEFEVRPGVEVQVFRLGDSSAPLDLEESTDLLTIFAPGGSKLEVRLDGDLQNSIAARVPALDTGQMSTRDFVGVVFGDVPVAPPVSAVPAKKTSWLGRLIKR